MVLATEQVIDWLVQRLAHDIPAGHFKSADYPELRQVRMLAVATAVEYSPEFFRLERVKADNISLAQILNHARRRIGIKGHPISLTNPFYAIIGGKSQEYPVTAPVVRGWVAHHKCLQICYLHGRCPPQV